MNALFLKGLAAKTHRGQKDRVEAGGSLGYEVVNATGEPVWGGRWINEAQAGISGATEARPLSLTSFCENRRYVYTLFGWPRSKPWCPPSLGYVSDGIS